MTKKMSGMGQAPTNIIKENIVLRNKWHETLITITADEKDITKIRTHIYKLEQLKELLSQFVNECLTDIEKEKAKDLQMILSTNTFKYLYSFKKAVEE